VAEALELGAPVEDIFVADESRSAHLVSRAEERGSRVHVVTDAVLDSICDTVTPQGIAAIVGWEPRSVADLLTGTPLVLVMASVRDPGNAGTLVRSALAAGATGVVVARGAVDPLHPKTVRASAGAIFRIPILRDEELSLVLAELRRSGVVIVGADAGSETAPDDVDLSGSVALVLGNESWGLPEEVRSEVDATVGIPMPGPAESLNVAIAGSILLFEAVRQRRLSSPFP
jgi:RNA methyltransferase, TrmH family